MKKKLLAAVSIVALLGAAPVLAAQSQTDDSTMKQDSGSTTMQETKQDVKEGWDKTKKAVSDTAEDAADATKKGWDKTKNAVSNAADDATDATKEAYHDVKAFIFDKDSGKLDVSKVRINDRATADAMINTPVYNDNERVGVVKDIILNQDGKPVMVVIGDGDFFGLGKLAAFDYNSNMIRTNADGDFVMPLTEKSIDNAAEFSYDRKNTGDNVRVIPSNGYSVAKLLDAKLVNDKGEKLGDIENISFKDGKADQLIVGYNKILGFGGEDVALPYDKAKVVPMDGEVDFQLSANDASMITNYKKVKTN